jgi:hypothetical protein
MKRGLPARLSAKTRIWNPSGKMMRWLDSFGRGNEFPLEIKGKKTVVSVAGCCAYAEKLAIPMDNKKKVNRCWAETHWAR